MKPVNMKILPKYQKTVDQLFEDYEILEDFGIPNLPIYCNYINEREMMRIRREDKGQPKPWTDDPILANYRFTNVFREDDRVCRELVAAMHSDAPPDILLFNALVFRSWNCLRGWDVTGGWQDKFNQKRMRKLADEAHKKNILLFGSAYLIINSLMKPPKHRFFTDNMFPEVWRQREDLLNAIQDDGSLQGASKIFQRIKGLGSFLAYEVALDMQMLGLLPKPSDQFTWANPGPGARRGMNFIRGRDMNHKQSTKEFIAEMRELWDLSGELGFLHPHVREPFDMRCIENGLCETGKYFRVLEIDRAKRRYR